MDKIEILKRLKDQKLVAVIRAESLEQGVKIIDAVIEGGIKFIEVTFTVPNADALIEHLATKYKRTDIIIGAGTCLDSETARIAILKGAQFVVSPAYDEELVRLCNRYRVPVMTGAQTISEFITASEMGVDVIKVFPGDAYQPSIIKSFLGPLPYLNFMPTGGVSLDNVSEWINNGAFAVGTGGSLTKGALTNDYDAITQEAMKFVAKVSNA